MATLPALGFEERVGFALEAHPVYPSGVAAVAAPTDAIRVASFGVRPTFSRIAVPGVNGPLEIRRGTASASAPRVIRSARKVQGQIRVPFDFIDQMKLIYNALCKDNGSGAALGYTFTANTGPDGAQTGTNRHRFVMQDHTADSARSLSLVRFNGQRQDSFLGCYVRGWALEIPDEGPAMVTLDVLGQNYVKGTAHAIPSYSASPFAHLHEVTLSFHATVGTAHASLTSYGNIQSLSIGVQHTLREIGSTGLAGNKIRHPDPMAPSVVNVSFVTDWENNTWQDFWDAVAETGAFVALEIKIVSDINHSGGFPFAYICRIPAFMFDGDYPSFEGSEGPIPQQMSGRATIFDNAGTEETMQMDFYNAQTTLGL
jgi:hypothetical protein